MGIYDILCCCQNGMNVSEWNEFKAGKCGGGAQSKVHNIAQRHPSIHRCRRCDDCLTQGRFKLKKASGV